MGEKIKSEEEKVLELIDRYEEQEVYSEEAEAERIRKLDEEWDKTAKDIRDRVNELAKLLSGKDAKELKAARLEEKATMLYSFMERYNQTIALKMQNLADYIAGEALPKLAELQRSAYA